GAGPLGHPGDGANRRRLRDRATGVARRRAGRGRLALGRVGGRLRRPLRRGPAAPELRRPGRGSRGRHRLRRDPAPAPPRERQDVPGGGQGGALREAVHAQRRRGPRPRPPRPRAGAVPDGGDVDPLPAGGRRGPPPARRRGDRGGPIPDRGLRVPQGVRPPPPPVRPGPRRRRPAGCRRLPRLARLDGLRPAGGDPVPVPARVDRRRRAGRPALRLRWGSVRPADGGDRDRHPAGGDGRRRRRLDQAPPALVEDDLLHARGRRPRARDRRRPVRGQRVHPRGRRGGALPAGGPPGEPGDAARRDRRRRRGAGPGAGGVGPALPGGV
ncbi:MAG: Putative oxidoreductase, partial [uncultured Thermomicrobiales bacterium]